MDGREGKVTNRGIGGKETAVCELGDKDRRLLMILQRGLPLVSRPYLEIAWEMGDITEWEALDRIAALKASGIIRRLSGFFDSGRLGYVSVLCAAKVRPENLEKASALVNGYAGVTHNYVREHEYNMWFTLIARNVALRERILDQIGAGPWVEQLLRFYTRNRYKIQVTFDLEDRAVRDGTAASTDRGHMIPKDERKAGTGGDIGDVSKTEIRIVRALQRDLPLVPEPYRVLADELSMTEEELFAGIRTLAQKGRLKRIAAALRHENVGYIINAMIVWDVPEIRVNEAGEALAGQPRVTHCYDRNRQPEFDYNLYSMVHAMSEEEYESLLKELIGIVRPVKYEELRTVSELKKTGMSYFLSIVE